jgi:phage terminase small subunit
MNDNINAMGKSYYTKKKYRQRIDEIDQSRKKQSDESDITVLSTLNQMYNGYEKASESLSRHPSGTKASGLRKRLKGKNRISDLRFRFGEAEEQSSRLRKQRRSANHSIRLDAKKDLRTMMNDLGDDKVE